MFAVVAFKAPFPRFVFNEYTVQSGFGSGQFCFDLRGVPCFRCSCCTEMLLDGFAAEGIVPEVEEPCSTLDVCHAIRRGALRSGEDFTARRHPLELSDKLIKMMLNDAVEVDKLSVDIVKYPYFGRFRTKEKECRSTCKQFDITGMFGEQRFLHHIYTPKLRHSKDA